MKNNESKFAGVLHLEDTNKLKHKTRAKASTIKLGIDVHASRYVVVVQWENATPKPAQHFSPQEFITWVKKLQKQAQKIYSVYEAGCFGYSLHRELTNFGINSLVVAPNRLDESNKRVKCDKHDALQLCLRLDRYVEGNCCALAVIRVPSLEEEQKRAMGRQRERLVCRRKQLEAQGRSLLRLHAIEGTRQWWGLLKWKGLVKQAPQWIIQRLEIDRPILQLIDKQIKALTKELKQSRPDNDLPTGIGVLSAELLSREICDWNRFRNRKQVAAYTGLCPREYSSGESRRQGSITKHGNPRVRHLLIEMAWRLLQYQPNYHAWSKWRSVLAAHKNNSAVRKKAVVAVARQLAIDLWRIHTNRVRAQNLGLNIKTINKSFAADIAA